MRIRLAAIAASLSAAATALAADPPPDIITPESDVSPPYNTAEKASQQFLELPWNYSYYELVREALVTSTRYPPDSFKNREEGACVVALRFTRDGTIKQLDVVKGTGFPGLDAECLEVFKRIRELPAVPNPIAPDAKEFEMQIPIMFRISWQDR